MKITPQLLERYQQGLCTPAEAKVVEQWLNSAQDEPSSLTKVQLERMQADIWDSLSPTVPGGKPVTKFPLHKRVLQYAAAAIILLSVGISSYYFLNNTYLEDGGEPVAFEDYKTIETQRGQKRNVTLPDGSTIRLNYESEVRVPEKFEDSKRIIFLTGHAHFDVARDPGRPFIIYTENSKTQVLGTSFDIKTSKNAGETEIIVTSGKVAFSERDEERNAVTLTVNDRAVLKADRTIETSEVDAHKLTAWKNNQLIFEYQSLREIIKIIEPWYNVDITVEDQDLLNKVYRISADNPSLQELLEQMSFMEQFEYSIDGRNVIIK